MICRIERLIHFCPGMLVLALAVAWTGCQDEKPASPKAVAQTPEASTVHSPTPSTRTWTPTRTAVPSPIPTEDPLVNVPGEPGASRDSITTLHDEPHLPPRLPCGPIRQGSPLRRAPSHFVFWTPDSSQLVFSGANGTIWIVDADGSHLNRVLDASPEPFATGSTVFLYGFHGDLSPDGTQIVYTSCQFPTDYRYEYVDTEVRRDAELYERGKYNYEVATSGLDGSNQQRLTFNKGIDTLPVWSPDGGRMAFISDDTGNRIYVPITGLKLYLMMADGSNIQSIPLQFGVYDLVPPMWSPDGERLAVVLTEPTTSPLGHLAIYTVQSDGSESVRVADLGYLGLIRNPTAAPAWSPDSERVAFATSVLEEGSVVYSARFDGTDLHRIWFSGTDEEAIATTQVLWSPEGSEILFVADGVHVAGADDNGLRTLINGVGESTKAAWSPDGFKIAVYDPGRHIVTMDRDGTEQRVVVEVDEDGRLRAVQPPEP